MDDGAFGKSDAMQPVKRERSRSPDRSISLAAASSGDGKGRDGKSGGTGKDGMWSWDRSISPAAASSGDGKGTDGKSGGKGKDGKSDGKGKFKGKGGKSGGKVQGFNAMQMFLRVKDLRSRLLAGLVRIYEVLHDMDVLEGKLEAMV